MDYLIGAVGVAGCWLCWLAGKHGWAWVRDKMTSKAHALAGDVAGLKDFAATAEKRIAALEAAAKPQA